MNKVSCSACPGPGFCDVLGESAWSRLSLLLWAVDVCEDDGARVGRSKRGDGWHAGVDVGSDLSPDVGSDLSPDVGSDLSPDTTVFWSAEL